MRKILLPLVAGVVLFSCSASKNSSQRSTAKANSVKADTAKKKTVKSYTEVITDKAITQNGLFKVHKVEDRYFLEVSDSLINREVLIVNRVSKGAFTGSHIGIAGDYLSEAVVHFSKGPNNKLFLRQKIYWTRITDSSENGLYRAMEGTDEQPILGSFDIKAFSADSSMVIDITDYINSSSSYLFFGLNYMSSLKSLLNGYQADKSYIESIHSYPENVEIKTVKTFSSPQLSKNVTPHPITLEFNNSIVLLPKDPIRPRNLDPRVGFYGTLYREFVGDYMQTNWLLNRRRLEPKEEDLDKYKRGELVEPKKPIVYYIDPNTPKKWVPYLIQGVNDWQKAFEAAGFKNAIYALEAPSNDSTWSAYDARHNVIVYAPSQMKAVTSQMVFDPRSGEILESHTNWHHNMQELLHDRYLVQAGANDPAARKMDFDDETMGQLIRTVISREIGHTIGLQDNLLSSSLVPVDSLRSKKYVEENGLCPSIMDDVLINYVAQPEDGLDRKSILPRIGVYDKWAIEWGYKLLPNFKSREEEETYMNQWVINRTEKDKRLLFGDTDPDHSFFWANGWAFPTHPQRQIGDLGDDGIKASGYGIKNLKRVMSQLKEWTKEPGEDYESLARLKDEIFKQYEIYINHVLLNIGGLLHEETTVEQKREGVGFIDRNRQKAAVKFLGDELFTTPNWLMDKSVLLRTAGEFDSDKSYVEQLREFNKGMIDRLVSAKNLENLITVETMKPGHNYLPDEFLTDLENGLWKELAAKAPIDQYRRELQKAYINDLIIGQSDILESMRNHYNAGASHIGYISDISVILNQRLRGMLKKINAAIPGYKDELSKAHLMELKERINTELYQKKEISASILNADRQNNAINSLTLGDNNSNRPIQPESLYNAGEYLATQQAAISTSAASPKKDSASPATKLKPYKEVITSKAITQTGMLTVHKVDDKYYMELEDSLFNRDILVVTRAIKGTNRGYSSAHAGDWLGESVVRFAKGDNNKIYLKQISYDVRSNDTTENGLHKAVENTNLQPIVASFDVATVSPNGGLVVDITSYLNSDNNILFFAPYAAGYKLGGSYDADKSYIQSVRAYPENVEISTLKTYSNQFFGFTTFQLNTSMVLLPKEPMKPRMKDDRVGYFVEGYYNYEASKPADIDWMITRWRLEPKEEDIEKYKRGELVEPKKPIVYYIDPSTPKKWVPYLIKGVNAWQSAFEKAGFKNAIYALEAPANDSTWSLEDARHSVIVFKPSRFENASGPNVHDPRTGEILETHINWYYSVQKLLHDWYMVQAGATDVGARKMAFDDALMGRLMEFVCTHEVGHTLGLLHNFGSSSTIPVDSLRSKKYIEANNGYCPSIMDYARFNYVAQPEDGMERKDLIPSIGVYDKWAIEWGYKWLPELKTREEEKAYMNQWISSNLEKDKRLWYGSQVYGKPNFDARRQSEDIGDDPVKASRYGIENLKRIMPNLVEWSKIPNKDYESLVRMQRAVLDQYLNYMGHVATVIGGLNWTNKTVEQKGVGATIPTRAQQKAAVQFFNDEVFTTPKWLVNNDIYRLSANTMNTYWNITIGWQEYPYDNWSLATFTKIMPLLRIVSHATYYNMALAQSIDSNAYTFDELLTDLETGIWKQLNTKAPIDMYDRDFQKFYSYWLAKQLDPFTMSAYGYNKPFVSDIMYSDAYTIIKGHLRSLLAKINAAIPAYKDKMTQGHLEEISRRIKMALEGKMYNAVAEIKENGAKNSFELGDSKFEALFNHYFNKQNLVGCWEDSPGLNFRGTDLSDDLGPFINKTSPDLN